MTQGGLQGSTFNSRSFLSQAVRHVRLHEFRVGSYDRRHVGSHPPIVVLRKVTEQEANSGAPGRVGGNSCCGGAPLIEL